MFLLNKDASSFVSFPGLGIDSFGINNKAFDVADIMACFGVQTESFPVYWYGIIITLGIVLAFVYASFRAKYENIKVDDIIDVALWTVALGILGARLYYVLTTIETYIPDPFDFGQFIKNIFNLRQGGLAIYGGIICGILGIIIATKIKKMNTIKLMDMAGPGVMIAQSLGRWGNFFNGEAFGRQVAEGHPLYFVRMGLISNNSISDFDTPDMVYVHPTFLYESVWNLIGFVVINLFYKKKKFNGQIACMYLAWYGLGRFFIERLRTDSLYIPGTEIRISRLVGIVCFVVFGGLLIAGLIYSKKFNDPDARLTKFDEVIKPSVNQHPVFFAKKERACACAEKESVDDSAEGEDNDGENN